jgi:transposase-like protein
MSKRRTHSPEFKARVAMEAITVTARKDDAPAAIQAAIVNVAELSSVSGGGGLIHTTSG